MPQPLTDIAIRKQSVPTTLWDALPKFGLRVYPSGKKSFIVLLGSGKRKVIGPYPTISLQQARQRARELLAGQVLGHKEPAPSLTFQAALALFLSAAEQRNKPRTVADYRRLLTKHFAPLRGRPVDTISTRDVAEIEDSLKNTPTEAIHAFTAIRSFMRYCVRQGLLIRSPCEGMKPPGRIAVRKRVLSEIELRSVCKAAATIGYPFGHIVLLLVLTGQRRTEVASLRWEWIDQDKSTITLPAEITKNSREHTLPYGDAVAELLATVPSTEGYVFPAAKDRFAGKPATIFNGWGKPKARLDQQLKDVAPWTLHDLRRTFATGLASLNVPIHITERYLNHVSGTMGGIVSVYQQHSYIEELRAACLAWEAKLQRLLTS